MKTKHTPGPWKPMSHGETISINALGKDTYLGVAHVNFRGNFDAGIPSKLDRANARLIAAAPELLAACINAEGVLSEPGIMDVDSWKEWSRQTGAALRAAIAKARGE